MSLTVFIYHIYLQLPSLKEKYITLMADRLGYVPPSEATLPCHDICHIFDEIQSHGLIRYRNLFKFERMNSFMKQTLKNRAHGVASIMKNFNTHERTTMSGSLYLSNVLKFETLCRLHPVNGLPYQSLSSYVTNLHVEPPEETGEDRTILYDVPSSNVIELRGVGFDVTLSAQDINYLLADNVDICHEEEGFSVLKAIMSAHFRKCQTSPLWRFKDDMLGYMKSLLDNVNSNGYKRVIGNNVRRRDVETRLQCDKDLATLRSLISMDNPSIVVRFVYVFICLYLSCVVICLYLSCVFICLYLSLLLFSISIRI